MELLGHRVLQPAGPVAGRVSGYLHIPASGFSPSVQCPNDGFGKSPSGSGQTAVTQGSSLLRSLGGGGCEGVHVCVYCEQLPPKQDFFVFASHLFCLLLPHPLFTFHSPFLSHVQIPNWLA